MEPRGIYIFANDAVYDQVIALVNSIEANVSPDIPIAIVPYDNRLDRLKQDVQARSNLRIFDDPAALDRWETFARDIWAAHPLSSQPQYARLAKVRVRCQRRYAAFDGPFEKFVVYDGDSLAMKPLDDLFAKLDHYDFVFDDWEHAKDDRVAAVKLDRVAAEGGLSPEVVRSKLHCSSFFGAKGGTFDRDELAELKRLLIEKREVEWLNGVAEAFLFSYLTLRGNGGHYRQFNYTLSADERDRTGNCADADPFVCVDNVIYNQDGHKPIHRLHYMNYPATAFRQLAEGEAVDVPFRDAFLHYRYRHAPEQRPQQLVTPPLTARIGRMAQKVVKKLSK